MTLKTATVPKVMSEASKTNNLKIILSGLLASFFGFVDVVLRVLERVLQ
jgi:hypothetical protein